MTQRQRADLVMEVSERAPQQQRAEGLPSLDDYDSFQQPGNSGRK